MIAEEMLTTAEAAKFLRLKNLWTLCNWRSQDRGPAYCRVGRKIVYRLSDLMEFVEAGKITPENR